jgi:endonuclease/exonuclease/phosphatase family metal-dependent hydrolase
VLAVQEVGDPVALDDLAKAVGGYPHTATADPDGRGIRVGLLSDLPLLDVHRSAAFRRPLRPIQVDDTPATADVMGRPALVAAVTTPGGTPIHLITRHLKSKLLPSPAGRSPPGTRTCARVAAYALFRRAAEAATVRATATALLGGAGQQRAVIVLGDLNDTPEAATTQLLSGPPASEIGTPGYDHPGQGDRQRLWNLAATIDL